MKKTAGKRPKRIRIHVGRIAMLVPARSVLARKAMKNVKKPAA
jgi:hypothetical protein